MNLREENLTAVLQSPVFDAPPVVETSLGIRFAPIDKFEIVHFMRLAGIYESNYSKFELKPPIGPEVEVRFNSEMGILDFPVRCWYVNGDETQLVQIQRDLFVRNWRATAEKREYQHYEAIKPLFKRDWETFGTFLDQQSLKRPSIWQCEVSYVNQLVRGREWNRMEDIPKIFPIWKGIDANNLFIATEMASFTVAFRLPDELGILQFVLQPGVRRDGTEIFQLTATALGKPKSVADNDLYGWLDRGHLAVVNGFVRFTSDEAHQLWRMK